jgi:hypothetical protein
MIWACHWQTTTLCTCSMIAFACGWYVVTCSWFGFNSIIVIHLFELTFELAWCPIVKDNKLRSRVTCQPGVMKQILDGCCWLICGFDNFKPASGWIYHCECKQRLCFGWCPYCKWMGPTRSTQTMTQGSDSAILGGSSPYFLRSFFVIWHIWQVENKQPILIILCKTRSYHGIPGSLFSSSLSRMKKIFMLPGAHTSHLWTNINHH